MLRNLGMKPPWLKRALIFVGVGGTTAIIAVGAFLALVAWEMSPRKMCGSRGDSKAISPDGKFIAVLYEYDCGAATDFGTNLAIMPATETFDPFSVSEDRHVLWADSDHGKVGVDMKGMLPLSLSWKDGTHLEVTISSKARVGIRKAQSGPVRIEYVASE